MSWQDNGNGKGDRPNPWGNGPKGGGNNNGGGNRGGGGEPPNLDDIIRKGQQQFKSAMPGGMGGSNGILLGIIAAIVLWLASGIYQVENTERGVVLRFGKVVDVKPPGLHWHLPFPIESVETPAVTREHTLQIGNQSQVANNGRQNNRALPEGQMLTGDENIVDVAYTVVWVISDPKAYLFNVEDQEETVRAVAQSVLREVVGRSTFQEVITDGRQNIQAVALNLTQGVLNEYESGILIRRFQIESASPPNRDVEEAFIDVQKAQADREQRIEKAEGYRNEKVPQAQGQAEKITQEAEAYSSRIVNGAEGEAAKFTSVYNEYVKAKDITKRRIYLETMEEIFQGMDKIIMDDGSGQGVVPYLPLNELGKKKAESEE